ncbi:MAG: type II secretion system ATPase GspE [Alphaproteobacteria bacterium]
MRSASERPLGAFLVEKGLLDRAGLERAERLCKGSGERLNGVLTKLGLISERDMAAALAEYLDVPPLGAGDFPDAPVFDGKVSPNFLKEARIVPVFDTPEGLVLAMADPFDDYAIKAMQLIADKPVSPRVAVPEDIERAIDSLYGDGRSSIGLIAEQAGSNDEVGGEEDIERLKDLASEAPVIRLVNVLISEAVEARASDIHIEPFESALRVRYRVDGVLRDVEAPPNRFRAAIISRVKIMARLDIAERRLPQDGRIKQTVRGKEIDLRVSTLPTMYGESVSLRILDRGNIVLEFPALGFDEQSLDAYLKVLERPNGILLVTGPTGSGKTTTLYASLQRLNSPETNIVTVEDPIEYQLDGVNQIQTRPQIGLNFAKVLRSILRHDPDVIMIGEIRDKETADIAVQAALTGHVVLSTLHTNDAAGTISRLRDMGVEDYLLTSTVNGVLAQRLVRTLCPHCRILHTALPELVDQMQLSRFTSADPITLYRAGGCDDCNGTGYSGRTSILEFLVMTDTVRRLVLRRAETSEIHRQAVSEGMRTMYEDGVYKALEGITTLEEVLRVTRDV